MPKRNAESMATTDFANTEEQTVDVKDLKPGDIISNTEFMVVKRVSKKDEPNYVHVRTLDGDQSVSFNLFEYKSYKTPTQFQSTQKVSRTTIVGILQHQVKSHAFLVEFKKKDGTDRVMTARMLKFCGVFGRSDVMELKASEDNTHLIEQKRQIDHRTIRRLVFDGVEYLSTSK